MTRSIRLAAALATAAVLSLAGCASTPEAADPGTTIDSPTFGSPTEGSFDMTARSIDDPASIWVVSNKARSLDPAEYAPTDLVDVPVAYANPPVLRTEASAAVVEMFAAYTEETGLELASQSTYRSYASQTKLFNGYVSSMGLEEAERASARPGHSEHQTGLAIDIAALPANCTLEECFGETPQGIWLRDNSWRFGFVLRYAPGQEGVTGFKYEPWHFRYVGVELATEYHAVGATSLEQFFELPPAPDYVD